MQNPLNELPLLTSGRALSSARAVTLLVHGRGRTPEEMIALADRFQLHEMAFLAPTAASGTWYPKSFLEPLDENQPHLDHALDRLENLVSNLETKGFSRHRIAIVGFSQGACLAAEYMDRHVERWGALALLTGGVIGPRALARDAGRRPARDFRGTPMFFGCSDVDAWVPLDRVQATAELFTVLGAEVDLRVTPGMDHVISDAQVEATRALLEALLQR